MIGSFYDPMREEGCAFEELISFHGGLGGPQTRPFVLHPATLPLPGEPIVGAAAVHELLLGWRRMLEGGAAAPIEPAQAAAAAARAWLSSPAAQTSVIAGKAQEQLPTNAPHPTPREVCPAIGGKPPVVAATVAPREVVDRHASGAALSPGASIVDFPHMGGKLDPVPGSTPYPAIRRRQGR